MYKTVINILLLATITMVGAQTLEDSFVYVRSNKAWPNTEYMKNVVETERGSVDQSTAELVYTFSLIDRRSKESLELANQFSSELQVTASEPWQRDFAQFLEVTILGLRGDFSSQIVAAERAVNQIDYEGLYASDSEFIKVQMEVFGMSSARLEDTTNFLLGSALIKEDKLDSLAAVTRRIGDRELQKVLENAADTVKIMKSEDEGKPYVKIPPDSATENGSKQHSPPVTQQEASSVSKVIEEVSAPEPTVEDPAEVVVTEPIEEDVEQSSNWWLWLIGAVVLVGGIGLTLRRKS